MRRTTRSRVRAVGVAVLAVLVAGLAVVTDMVVWPHTDRLAAADAVVVLGGGNTADLVATAQAVVAGGFARVVVVSSSDRPPIGIVGLPPGVEQIPFRPVPFSTRGEARFVAQLARTRHWRRVIVVSGHPQTARARFRFTRCFGGQVLVHPAPTRAATRWHDVVYEVAALTKAVVLQSSC